MKLDMVFISLTPFAGDDAMVPEFKTMAEDILNRVEKAHCGTGDTVSKTCSFFFWEQHGYARYQGQYIRLLCRRLGGPRCILVFPSLYDVSGNPREAISILHELSSEGMVRDIFLSDVSLSRSFAEYKQELLHAYGLDSPVRLRLRMPDEIQKRADACRDKGLSFGDIAVSLHVSKSQVQNFRNREGVSYIDRGIPHPDDDTRAKLMKENRTLVDTVFSDIFISRNFTLD